MIDMEEKIQPVYKREPEGNSSKETECFIDTMSMKDFNLLLFVTN